VNATAKPKGSPTVNDWETLKDWLTDSIERDWPTDSSEADCTHDELGDADGEVTSSGCAEKLELGDGLADGLAENEAEGLVAGDLCRSGSQRLDRQCPSQIHRPSCQYRRHR
jgi:hypothetical protein